MKSNQINIGPYVLCLPTRARQSGYYRDLATEPTVLVTARVRDPTDDRKGSAGGSALTCDSCAVYKAPDTPGPSTVRLDRAVDITHS